MSHVSIPDDLEAWARAEVAAGRADGVDALVAAVLRERRDATAFVRATLEEARASRANGEGASLESVLGELEAWIADDEAAAADLRSAAG